MSGIGSDLSAAAAAAVEKAGRAVVRVEGRRAGPTSGVAWSPDGVLVAAHHNVERDEDVEVGLDGSSATASVVGRDPATDVVVLRAALSGLSVPDWSEEPARVGQLVLALSRPGRTVRASLGVVHAAGDEWRTPSGGRVDRYLQTDMAPQRGSSGGLLVDLEGRALGMANAGLLRGVGMALPPATLRRVVAELLAHGHVRRGFLGIGMMPVRLPADLRKETGRPSALLLTSVQEGSAAAKAGLRLGDVVLAVEGEPVTGPGDLLAYLEEDRIGTAIVVRAARGAEVRDVPVTVGTRGAEEHE